LSQSIAEVSPVGFPRSWRNRCLRGKPHRGAGSLPGIGEADREKRVASQHDLPLDVDIRMDPVEFRVALPAADPPDN